MQTGPIVFTLLIGLSAYGFSAPISNEIQPSLDTQISYIPFIPTPPPEQKKHTQNESDNQSFIEPEKSPPTQEKPSPPSEASDLSQEKPSPPSEAPALSQEKPSLSPKEQVIFLKKADQMQPTLDVKMGYFFFSNAKMRTIYNHGGYDVQISATHPIRKWLQVYGSVEYLEKHGKSLNDHQKTTLWAIPLSLGLRPVMTICKKTQCYLSFGPRCFFVHSHNDSSYVNRRINETSLGCFINMGLNFILYDHMLIDGFGEYSYCKVHVHSVKTNSYGQSALVGGFTLGVGVGYAF